MDISSETNNATESPREEFTLIQLDNATVIGEEHLRRNPSANDDKRFDEILEENKDSIYILESAPDFSDLLPEEYSPFMNSFMVQAQNYAKKNNIKAEIMDDEKVETERYRIWQEAGTDLTEEDYDNMHAVYIMHWALRSGKSLPQLISEIKNSELLDEKRKTTYLNRFLKFTEYLTQSDDIEPDIRKLDKFLVSYISYDGICRERYHQDKLSKIIKENPNKKILAVFGKAHLEGILKTLKDSTYRTPLPSSTTLSLSEVF